MNTFEAVTERRSVKHYDASHQMSDEEIEKLLSHTLLSPTSYNIQNWRFVVASDAETLKSLRAASWDQAQVTDASITLILCADLKAWEKSPERYWKNAPEAVSNMLVPMIGGSYKGNEQLQRDEAMRSCGIAAQTIMLLAKEMGYDSCPMDGFEFGKVGDLINLPKDHIVSMFVVIGKAIKDAWSRPGHLEFSE
ncbi:MAG: nitroreductase family protein, partial [Opitutaceae bacterium]|nr:nitroreductase family protein [Opitutaceae bacterium]